MATHKVVLKPSVEKDLRALPKSMVARMMKRIAALSDDPFPEQSIKLTGTERLYRIRIGEYRIVYGVDKAAREVIVHHVRHRREVYRRV
jgi:mRNA interferase RelE/StbE